MLQLSLAIDYVNFTFPVLNANLCKFEEPDRFYVSKRITK